MFSNSGSWRSPFYLFGIVGAISACLVWWTVPKDFLEAVDMEGVRAAPLNRAPAMRRLFNRNLVLCAAAFSLIGISFFSYVALYSTYLRTEIGFTAVSAGVALGMYGIGTLGAFFCGWLGDRLMMYGMYVVMAATGVVGFFLFHDATSEVVQGVLPICFGLLISGYLHPRFVSLMQRNVGPSQIGYAMSITIPMFYAPGLFVGYAFGECVAWIGWGTSSALLVALPPLLASMLMTLYKPSEARGA